MEEVLDANLKAVTRVHKEADFVDDMEVESDVPKKTVQKEPSVDCIALVMAGSTIAKLKVVIALTVAVDFVMFTVKRSLVT